jgi:hypothetical protein
MSGYMLIEQGTMQTHKVNGIRPNPIRMGILDYMRELRHEVFPFNQEHQLILVGLEEVLLAAGARHIEVSLFIRNILASKAFELDAANLGLVQVVFRRSLKRADDFWFEVGGGKRVSLRPIFDSPMRETDAYGNDYYRIGFNLT